MSTNTKKYLIIKKILLALILLIVIVIVLLGLYYKLVYRSGFTIIINNKTTSTITLEYVTKETTEKIIFEEIEPKSKAMAHRSFKGTEAVAVKYYNKNSEEIIIPLMYVYNFKSTNVSIFEAKEIDEKGNITEFKYYNSNNNFWDVLFYEIMH